VKYLKFKTAGCVKLLYQLIICYKFNSTNQLMDLAQAEMTHSLETSALKLLQVIKPESSKIYFHMQVGNTHCTLVFYSLDVGTECDI